MLGNRQTIHCRNDQGEAGRVGEGRYRKIDTFVLDPGMIKDTVNIVNEAIKEKIQVTLIVNKRAGGNAPLIAQKIADRLHKERQQRLF